MMFLKVISVFCGVALVLGLCADATILLLAQVTGGFGILWRGRFGQVPLFLSLWVIAFVLGALIARRMHVLPVVH